MLDMTQLIVLIGSMAGIFIIYGLYCLIIYEAGKDDTADTLNIIGLGLVPVLFNIIFSYTILDTTVGIFWSFTKCTLTMALFYKLTPLIMFYAICAVAKVVALYMAGRIARDAEKNNKMVESRRTIIGYVMLSLIPFVAQIGLLCGVLSITCDNIWKFI